MQSASKTSFREYISKELELISTSLPFNVKNYLIDLLCFYISSDRFFEKKAGQSKSYERALADLYKKSQAESQQSEKIYIFKKMGDFSLYISGFFREAVKRKIVHISYYEIMGKNAYNFVSYSYGSRPNVFKELALEFKHLSQILFSLQKRSAKKQDSRYLLNFPTPPSNQFLN